MRMNPDGKGPIILVCEHASNAMPPEFRNLGLDRNALESHIAWDPGALSVARQLSASFDAPLIAPDASRLLYDCNRPATAVDAMPEKSENSPVPGNRGLSVAARNARVERFYRPYRADLEASITRALSAGRDPAIVTIHSFTPLYSGARRDLDLGVLHDSDARLADEILFLADADAQISARRNEPYGPDDGVTHTLKEHAIPRELLNVMLEIRNDLIADTVQITAMAKRLTGYLNAAIAKLKGA